MKMFWKITGGLFAAIFVLLIFSAIVAEESAFTTNPAQAGGSSGPQGPAPTFVAETVSGETINLTSLHQEKPVILDFWATWCPNCRRDMPVLNELANKYQDQVTVLGVNLQEDESSIRDFNSEFGIDFDSVLDAGEIARSYGVAYTNTHVLIDTDGNIVNIVTGDITEAQVIALIGDPV